VIEGGVIEGGMIEGGMIKDLRESAETAELNRITEENFRASFDARAAQVDRMMIWLLGAEWLGMIAVAAIIAPFSWDGNRGTVNPHLLAALLSGPAIILPIVGIALLYPAGSFARHAIAVGQMLVSALLIDCTGGRIETHFHIFGSLAFLAFYRDPRVLVTASAVTVFNHLLGGVWWPQSVYGVLTISPWRWVEHLWWIAFEDFFLLLSIKSGLREARLLARNAAVLYLGASHDVLTGLANRRLLRERFEQVARRDGAEKCAILFVDLDRFRHANDTLGHAAGDRLLVLLSARFSETIGVAGTVARIGGDEFVILLDRLAGLAEAEATARRVLRVLTKPFHVEGHTILLSASVGISLAPDHGTNLAVLQERADRAMYIAKSQGRNQYVAFSEAVCNRERLSREIGIDLAGAMERDEFELYFQPLMRRNGRLAGFEALLRWRHPNHGIILPTDFIPVAEESGLIERLGDWVLGEACRACRRWQTPGQAPVGVAVNVSAQQFEQPDYPDRVLEAVEAAGIEPALLTLELTESVLVKSPRQAREHLVRLREAGVQIALDDFGTGYSSLSYLTELPADLIKLDRSFLRGELAESHAVVESIVNLAHRLNLEVVAEGVETLAQKQGLTDLDCDQFQGFYFSRPVTESEVAGLIASRS
jgi:diguanylate cyclase (GGDEF)-like protein